MCEKQIGGWVLGTKKKKERGGGETREKGKSTKTELDITTKRGLRGVAGRIGH